MPYLFLDEIAPVWIGVNLYGFNKRLARITSDRGSFEVQCDLGEMSTDFSKNGLPGRAAHYDDRDHPLRRIATTCYDRLRPVKAPLGPLGDSQYSQMASSGVEAVPVVNRRDPRALRSAPTADAAARAGGPC